MRIMFVEGERPTMCHGNLSCYTETQTCALTDKAGKNLVPSKMIGKNYADQDWFKLAVDGKIAPGTAHYTDLRIDTDTGSYASTDGKVMIFTAPIRDANTGEVLGVWSNRMSWTDVVNDIVVKESEKLKSEKIPKIAAYLVNQDGTYLVHHDNSKVLSAKSNSVADFMTTSKDSWSHSLEDEDVIGNTAVETFTKAKGYASYPGHKWTYVLRAPQADPDSHAAVIATVIGMALIACAAFLAAFVTSSASKTLEQITFNLKDGSEKVSHTASEVTKSAHSLSESSTEQASALQETAASIEEINAMIKKSNENSHRSKEVAEQSSKIANRGKDSVEKMSEAINEINISNEAILNQISESNIQISDIARVIAEIGSKTKVINDIVFQTKLLSFNASVEAARAGEHGKGFAVVAEEVGNLASMSGNAAKEISEMLALSIKNVESIVDNTKQKVERLIHDGRQKVQSGIVIAGECASVLDEVVKNVDELNTMVSEILVASHEQSQGVNEITKAMNELDQTTHANASTSQHVSGFATSLSNDSVDMNEMVRELNQIVAGGGEVKRDRDEARAKSTNVVDLADRERPAKPAVKKLKKASGDSTPSAEDPRFKDV